MAKRRSLKSYTTDTDMTAGRSEKLCKKFKKRLLKFLGASSDDRRQLLGAIGAVFKSWKASGSVIPEDRRHLAMAMLQVQSMGWELGHTRHGCILA